MEKHFREFTEVLWNENARRGSAGEFLCGITCLGSLLALALEQEPVPFRFLGILEAYEVSETLAHLCSSRKR